MLTTESDGHSARLQRLMHDLAAESPEHKINPSLQDFLALLDVMGDPQSSLQTIIVGGTNGKTSTTLMLESLASTLGYSVGVFTSPHLRDPRERIRLNENLVAADVMADAIERVNRYADLLPIGTQRPTYFEALTAAALEIFADLPVDLAILEVGMGGRWDATNVTNPAVACIMPISLDHMEFLGDTVEEIAQDKSQIIKASSVAVAATQPSGALSAIEDRCVQVGAPLLYENRDFAIRNRVDAVGGQRFDLQTPTGDYKELFLPLFGSHQASNAAVAVVAIEQALTSKAPLPDDLVAAALGNVSSPGRLEIVAQNPLFIIDACHNPAGAQVTANALTASFALNDFILIFGVMKDKNAVEILRPLLGQCVGLVAVAIDSPRATEVVTLAAMAREHFPDLPVHEAKDVSTACQLAIDLALKHSAQTGVLAAGSVALVGAVRGWALDE